MRKPKIELTDELQSLQKRTDTGLVTMTRAYRLITPLYGGGVVAGEVDEHTPIRGTEVRGHLRFWWRATRGGQFGGSLKDMKAAEDRIWGSADSPSKVSLAVKIKDKGTRFKVTDNRGEPTEIGNLRSAYSYVAFPLRESKGSVQEGITFTLTLTFPAKFNDDIQAALWAWDTFGGIGARTRRGFGALACDEVAFQQDGTEADASGWHWLYSCQDTSDVIIKDLTAYVSTGEFHQDLPHLSHDATKLKVTGRQSKATTTWKQLFNALQNFRQSRNPGTEPNRPGRSHWPEPDAIRGLSRASRSKHSTPIYTPTINKFPRADFGLPIIFQFKDHFDPGQTSLEGKDHARLGSPLILRPLACQDDQYVGVAIVLDGPRIPPGGLELKDAPGNPSVDSQLDGTEAAQISSKNGYYNGNADILQAFLDSL